MKKWETEIEKTLNQNNNKTVDHVDGINGYK